MAAKPDQSSSPIQLTIATSEVKQQKSEGILFYVLPPLVIAAVFVFCSISKPDIKAPAPAAPAVTAQQKEALDNMDVSDLQDDEGAPADDEEPAVSGGGAAPVTTPEPAADEDETPADDDAAAGDESSEDEPSEDEQEPADEEPTDSEE